MTLRTESGQSVIVAGRLAAGGEGEVFRLVAPRGTAFKRYLRPVLDRNPTLPDRVATMIRNRPVGSREHGSGHVVLAWPEATVLDDGRFAGFLMPLIDTTSTVELHRVTNPTDRRAATGETVWLRGFAWNYLIRTAANLALAVQAVHETGAVIGDFNERNIRVSRQACVTLLDCDSMQVYDPLTGRTFHCHVGRADFTAPELVGADWRTTVRRPESDLFALAIHLYQLLLEGEHPFRGRWTGSGAKPAVSELARIGVWTYAGRPDLAPRPSAIGIELLPASIRDLFHRAFERGAAHPDERPSAAEWHAVLTEVEATVVQCRSDPGHFHPGTARRCPWCAGARSARPVGRPPHAKPRCLPPSRRAPSFRPRRSPCHAGPAPHGRAPTDHRVGAGPPAPRSPRP